MIYLVFTFDIFYFLSYAVIKAVSTLPYLLIKFLTEFNLFFYK